MSAGQEDRAFWVESIDKIVRPILTALAQRKLKSTMPVETHPGNKTDRRPYTHLEALARSLTGIAPWLELPLDNSEESKLRNDLADLARQSIDAGTSPQSPDYMNFTQGGQPLVDAAFLAQAIIRAPNQLWVKLPQKAKQNTIAALKQTRNIKPGNNNWVLFSAMVEAALAAVGEQWEIQPVDFALTKLMSWYKGDSLYGDGPQFHCDYYNSFVIHPMLIDVLETISKHKDDWNHLREPVLTRAKRYAAIQERLISPQGTFPPIGRSLTYRFGAFHLLAQMALRKQLPNEISPGQVRCALTAVIQKMITAEGTFDQNGFLQIGFAGHQPTLAETYISTGSLYLCTTGLLPLGLPANDEFWTCEETDWTQKRAWSGQSLAPDHAISD